RHMEKEVQGAKIFKDNKIPAPQLYYAGQSADKQCYVLIFERLKKTQSLDIIWKNRDSYADAIPFYLEKQEPFCRSVKVPVLHGALDNVMPILRAVMIELATQHVLGVDQQDLHFKNFLIGEKNIYTLDGGQLKLLPEMLNKKQSLN